MTEEKRRGCEALLATGLSIAETARRTQVKRPTLSKAIKRGDVKQPPVTPAAPAAASKPEGESVEADSAPAAAPASPGDTATPERALQRSDRVRDDAACAAAGGLGTACHNADERILAAAGLSQGALSRFHKAESVRFGGLLAALPVLLQNGLLHGIGHLRMPGGYYQLQHILFTLAFIALARIKRPEHLRHIPPGELGLVLGIDRSPEAKTVRGKIQAIANNSDLDAWTQGLTSLWMENDPEAAGYAYVDGHTRVYSGSQAKLPPRFVSREKLCLPGTTDYWVSDLLGRPFFVVSKAVTEGFAATLLGDIVPLLIATIPGQPSQAQLDADPKLHRFVIVFDREGSFYALIHELWTRYRIAVITYRRAVKDRWPEADFKDEEVTGNQGEVTTMRLARKTTELTQGKASIPVEEIRRLSECGHQTAIITTASQLSSPAAAAKMFSRWCQENYFKYMMENYDIDGLVEYGSEAVHGTSQIPNPAWKAFAKPLKNLADKIKNLKLSLALPAGDTDDKTVHKQSQIVDQIHARVIERNDLLTQRRQVAKHIQIQDLPEDQRPTQLKPLGKRFSDTIKMICYRAETQLVSLLRELWRERGLEVESQARALIRQLLVSDADLIPDAQSKTLTVRIHNPALPCQGRVLNSLLAKLTALEFRHPGTRDKIIYEILAPEVPSPFTQPPAAGQEV